MEGGGPKNRFKITSYRCLTVLLRRFGRSEPSRLETKGTPAAKWGEPVGRAASGGFHVAKSLEVYMLSMVKSC